MTPILTPDLYFTHYWSIRDQNFEVEFYIDSCRFQCAIHENVTHFDAWPLFHPLNLRPKFRSWVLHWFLLLSVCHSRKWHPFSPRTNISSIIGQFKTKISKLSFTLIPAVFCVPFTNMTPNLTPDLCDYWSIWDLNFEVEFYIDSCCFKCAIHENDTHFHLGPIHYRSI